MVPKKEASDCCERNNIFAELTEADFEGDFGQISQKHVYGVAQNWVSH